MLKLRGSIAKVCLLIAAAVASGCGGSDAQIASSSGSDIIGGKADVADVAVVELVEDIGEDEYTCTATFIGPRTLLTAAHCVVGDADPHTVPAKATFHLMTGSLDSVATKSDVISISRANVHPHPSYDGDAAHDVAIVVLDHAVSVTPIPINRNPMTKAMVGNAVRLVGYGQSARKSGANDGTGRRRTVSTTFRGLDGNLALIGNTGQQACDGDSGGPAIMTIDGVDTLVATDDLAASDVDCTRGDLYQRVDLQLTFIDLYL